MDRQNTRRTEALFFCAVAPILRCAKPASLMTLIPGSEQAWCTRRNALCRATGLRFIELHGSHGCTVLLVYDEDALCRVLRHPQAKDLLDRYGYAPEGSLAVRFARLQERFATEDFPHEIGVFLGYPLDDVSSFIAHRGQDCLCSRYWKVYHNPERAQEIFARIDAARAYAQALLGQSLPVHITANRLKTVT